MTDPISPTPTSDDLLVIDAHVGRRLRMLRAQSGLTQATLGHKIGAIGRQVQKYEQGINRLTAGHIYAIAQTFGVSADALYIGFDPNSPYYFPHDPISSEVSATLRHAAGITDQNTRDKLKKLFETLAASGPTPDGKGAS